MKNASFFKKLSLDLKTNPGLYLLILPGFILLILFSFVPLYGIILAFKEYDPSAGIAGSEWVGLNNFVLFFQGEYTGNIFKNTIIISLLSLVVGFIFPLLFALGLNNLNSLRFKKIVQLVSYAPYFISTVVIVAMINIFFGSETGIINNFLKAAGSDIRIDWTTNPKSFFAIYVWSGLWQTLGWSSIIYISALSSVPPELYEAATLEGATKMQKIRFIEIPTIAPTIVTLLILSAGSILGVGFEKVYLMQNIINSEASEVISTYAYKTGFGSGTSGYGISTAIGLFNSVVSFIMLAIVNFFAKKTTNYSIF